MHQPVLDSWLHTLNYVRNVVAHHARLWNREMPIRPKIPERRHRPEFHMPASISGERKFGVLSLLRYLMLQVAPQSKWPQRMTQLLDEYREIPLSSMGFPANWREFPLWK